MPKRLLLAPCLALLCGCRTERTLAISTDPPGAEVRLDNEYIGVTPVRVRFEHYGTRRLTFYLPGYQSRSEQLRLGAPWYFRFPMDIVTEVFLPLGWKDRRAYHVALVPGEEAMSLPSLRSVIDRANVLRHSGPEGPRHLPEPEPQEALPEEEEEEEEEDGAGAEDGPE